MKEYNDSLKEQLRSVGDGFMKENEEASEGMSEEIEIFKQYVYSPTVIAPVYTEKEVLDSIHHANILCVVFWDKNDMFLFSSDVDNRLVCINRKDKSVVCETKVSAPCCSLTIVNNGTLLLAGCMDGLLHIFCINTMGYVITSLMKLDQKKLHEKAILKLRSCDSLNAVLSTSYDNTVALFSVDKLGTITEKARYYFKYTCDGIVFSPKHHSIIIAERNQPFITYINLDTQEKTEVSINNHEWDLHVSFCITDMCLMHDEDYVITLTDKGRIIIFSYGRNTHIQVIYEGSMLSDSYYNGVVSVDREEKHVLTICPDYCIHVFSLYSGKEVAVLKGHSKTIRNMTCQRDLSTVLFTCSYDHSIRVWQQIH